MGQIKDHLDQAHDHSNDHIPHHSGNSLGIVGDPVRLVFPDPQPALDHSFSSLSWQAVSLGGITVSIIALVAIACVVLILASAVTRGGDRQMLEVAIGLVIVLAVTNLIRITGYLLGADLYTIRRARSKAVANYRPTVSLVVPMHNEGAVVKRTLDSLLAVDYRPLQIIVADDGSTDDTLERIHAYKRFRDPQDRIEVFSQPNGGKAHVLNHAITKRATGELVYCLDGDSTLAPDAITKSVAYFADERVVATASNVNILPDGTVLGFVQRFEYLVNHHMKKAQTAFNLEYIIGGIGSMFRRETLAEVGYYDTNTMTEDIDLTLKIIAVKGNRSSRVVFAADALVYTEAVPSFRSLVKQRTRWKYGRAQTFYKNRRLFFSRERKHTVLLSWLALPTVVVQEFTALLEPLSVAFILTLGIVFHDLATILSSVALMTAFSALNILGNTHISRRERWVMVAASPLMYPGFYLITVVEYLALGYLIAKLHRLPASVSKNQVTWVSPERSGANAARFQGRHPAAASA
jgi:cellulose synthase/poly-beta-1,6-N-acetylglucosamine synthase-like glycosyltransferase